MIQSLFLLFEKSLEKGSLLSSRIFIISVGKTNVSETNYFSHCTVITWKPIAAIFNWG